MVNNGGVAELRVASGAVIDFETEKTIPVTVTATDAGGLTSSKTFTIAVSNVNEAPTAGADAFATAEDTPVTFTVLGNDSDPDAGTTLSITQIDGNAITAGGAAVALANGTVALNIDGSLTFTPNLNYNGRRTSPTRYPTAS